MSLHAVGISPPPHNKSKKVFLPVPKLQPPKKLKTKISLLPLPLPLVPGCHPPLLLQQPTRFLVLPSPTSLLQISFPLHRLGQLLRQALQRAGALLSGGRWRRWGGPLQLELLPGQVRGHRRCSLRRRRTREQGRRSLSQVSEGGQRRRWWGCQGRCRGWWPGPTLHNHRGGGNHHVHLRGRRRPRPRRARDSYAWRRWRWWVCWGLQPVPPEAMGVQLPGGRKLSGTALPT